MGKHLLTRHRDGVRGWVLPQFPIQWGPEAAIDVQDFAGDEAPSLSRQVKAGTGDVIDYAYSLDRNGLDAGFAPNLGIVVLAPAAGRVDGAGLDGICGNTMRPEFQRQRLSKSVYPRLASDVVGTRRHMRRKSVHT